MTCMRGAMPVCAVSVLSVHHISHSQMACVPGRCPCWPRTEPFDAAEMDLLAAVRGYMGADFDAEEALWASIPSRCLAVRRHRRAYVLSVIVNQAGISAYRMTLLGWQQFIMADIKRMQWVLDQGVCPNIAGAYVPDSLKGWAGGAEHPGRPTQAALRSPLAFFATSVHVLRPLLGAGAYPVDSQPLRMEDAGFVAASTLWARWRAWHGRASRRLWAASWSPE